MAIIKQYPETMSAEIKYDLIKSPKIQKISMCKGQRLDVDAYIIREDTTDDGMIVTVCSIRTPEGEMYATNSRTFIREFEVILDCVGSSPFAIEVLDGISRAGRHFVTCAWAH